MSLYVELLRHVSLLFRRRLISVDIAIERKDGSIVFVKRSFAPFKGQWALPGGFLKFDETVEEAATREAKEETGLEVEIDKVIGVYSNLKRDPRGHVISIVLKTREVGGVLKSGSDAEDVKAFKEPPEKLAFDHGEILKKL